MVSGTVTFTVADKTYEAATGTLVMIPPGAPHTFANPGDQPAVLLNTFTPDLYVQYFRDLRDMIASGQDLTPAATIAAMSRYATVPATDFASPACSVTSFPTSFLPPPRRHHDHQHLQREPGRRRPG